MNDRLKQIYDVALVAISEKGYHGTSLRDIASAVGIQTPSLYNYFAGKQDLLFHLMRSTMEDLIEDTRAAVEAEPDDSVLRLRAAIGAFVLFNTSRPHEAAVSDAGLSILDPEQRKQVVLLRDQFDQIYVDLISEGCRRGDFRATDANLAKNAMTSACARIYLWYRPEGQYSPRDLADTLSGFLIAGLVNPDRTNGGSR